MSVRESCNLFSPAKRILRELKESCEIESFKESRALLYEKLVISFEGRSLPFSDTMVCMFFLMQNNSKYCFPYILFSYCCYRPGGAE